MKKYLLLSLLTFVFYSGYSQGGPGDGGTPLPPWMTCFEFNSQAQIDSFPINYPGQNSAICLKIFGPDITNVDSLYSIESINGNLIIGSGLLDDLSGPFSGNPLLASLVGLSNINSIEGNILIYENDLLEDFNFLSNISSCDFLWIIGNNGLTDLSGLDNLTTVNGWLGISDNNLLTDIIALQSISSVGHNLTIGNNENLSSLDGLQGITSIGMHLAITDNPILEDITVLENINSESIASLSIFGNPLLSDCSIETVCNYINSENAVVSIENNLTGCNTQQEVEDACSPLSVNEIKESTISIYPNPTKDFIYISNEDGLSIDEINICNQVGQKVYQLNNPTDRIDVSSLKSGMYVVEVIFGDDMIREKVLVE